MSAITDFFVDLRNFFLGGEKGLRQIQTSPVAFAAKTAKILDWKSSRPIRLFIVKLEGNLRNDDLTRVTIGDRTYKFYGNFTHRTSVECNRLAVEPSYGATRYGILNLTYEGEYISAATVGAAAQPLSVISLIEKVDLITLIGTISEITNVKNLESLDLIDLITEITTIKTIEKIDEITTIRDLMYSGLGVIKNPSFEQDFVGWKNNLATIDDSISKYGDKSVKFTAGGQYVEQHFEIPLKTSWLTQWFLWVRRVGAPGAAIRLVYDYTDATQTQENLSVTAGDIFKRKVLSPTADKYIEKFQILATESIQVNVDGLTTVFG